MTEPNSRDDAIAWRPDEETRRRAQLTRFMTANEIHTFEELYRKSVADVSWFTERVLAFLDVPFDRPYSAVVDLSAGLPWAKWCVDGALNISRCVDQRAEANGQAPALVWEGETGTVRSFTYRELHRAVEKCAAGFRAYGIGRGDAVGIHLPMLPETVIALLAVARIGAIAVPLFSGYGPAAIESRLNDVAAKALVTCDGFSRRGKEIEAKSAADEALDRCQNVQLVVVVRYSAADTPMSTGRDIDWETLMESGSREEANGGAEATDAEDPLLVLYSSGTTGRPKGILHSHCGFPIKSAQDMAFGTDVGPGDRITWITDLGWMMGPWLIYGSLLLGATLVLYDGAPDYPDPGRLWSFVSKHKVNVLGISPTLVRGLMEHGVEPVHAHDLSSLRILGSTGEPWNPGPWWWLFDNVGGSRIPIINYSGGTEISGGILGGNPLLPMKPGSFPAPCPGIAADVADEQGRSVRGAVGELVIRGPWIGMARGFWRDRERYLDTYWSRWPDTWVHGDWAQVDDDGQWYILGRSDDTLKIAGKRVGPAEVESILVAHDAVLEAAVIGVPDELKGTAMVAFCVLNAGVEVGPQLESDVAARVARELGKPLKPKRVLFVPTLPKTRNAKVMRRLIRAAYLGEPLGDTSALENPAAIEGIQRRRDSLG